MISRLFKLSDTTSFTLLDEWLRFIENLHSKAIDLGLERMQIMLKRMDIQFSCPVITVGGTNGKGSTCNCMEQILLSQGYKVGVHTSPHLIRFNERARINGSFVSDEELIRHFKKVEEARKELTLSYFEYTLLGILSLFKEKDLDVLILEIGLGGRLDAVNTVESDAAIVTSIGIDHVAFLGDTREKIGWEKAHIYRKGKPAVCADPEPPSTLVEFAENLGADFIAPGKDYQFARLDDGNSWSYEFRDTQLSDLPLPALEGEHQLRNAAGAIAVLLSLKEKLPVSKEAICSGLKNMEVTGRFQKVSDNPEIILDVGHNPHAAKELERTLKAHPTSGKKIAVIGMLKDKDRAQVCRILSESFDLWFLTDLSGPRGGSALELKEFLLSSGITEDRIFCFGNVENAVSAAINKSECTDTIVVLGSFLTVTGALQYLHLSVK